MMNRFFAFLLCAAAWVCALAQTVSNVRAHQEGKNVVITYTTDFAGVIDAVYCSTDGGETWGEPLKSVTGDVHKSVPEGDHRIVWNVFADRSSLTGSDIRFKVITNSAKIKVRGVSFEMVRVEGGTFHMGATDEQGSAAEADEKPVHNVTLRSFYIGKTEVTQELWEAVMDSNPSKFKGPDLPVENVSYEECQLFVEKLSRISGRKFRLPTEAEWEYACRGGEKSRGYRYSGGNNIDAVAWYNANSGRQTHPVGTKAANELGICDMSGNVWEWCSDWYGSYGEDWRVAPTGPESGTYRVYRGGSWSSGSGICRAAFRGNYSSSYRGDNLGLRLVLY